MVVVVPVDRPPETDRRGEVLAARFRLDAAIGKGAMADVYRAVDEDTAAYVAVKILRSSVGDDPAVRQRFAREGEVQSRLRHNNIAALLATGVTPRGEPYLVVELLRGKTLRGVLRDGRVEVRRAASYAWQALQGLAAVHHAGVVHRDLKPANIMLEPSPGPVDRVVLIDFGFATFEGSARLTQQGTVVGSLRYIAPERLRGEPIDQRSDIYSLGVILYELLAGAPPFVGKDDLELVELHLNAPMPSLPPDIPAAFSPVLRRALAKFQEERFASAGEMARALEQVATTLR